MPFVFGLIIFLAKSTKYADTKKRIDPWPMAPNIIPKKKGKVAMLSTAGFASKYVGIPYVSTIV